MKYDLKLPANINVILCAAKQQVKEYESCHDAGSHPESKRATEDAQEDAEGLQQSRGLEAVAVVSCRLVRHDGAEGQRDRDAEGNVYTEIGNGH